MPIERFRSLAFWSLLGCVIGASFSNSIFEIFSGLFLSLTLLTIVMERRWDLFKNAFAAAAGFYLLMVLLSWTQSSYPDNSARGSFRVLRLILMAVFTAYHLDEQKKFRLFFLTFCWVALILGLDALAQGALGRDPLRGRTMTPYLPGWNRLTGPFHHANDFSAYLSLAVFFFLGMLPWAFTQKKAGEKVFAVAGAGLLLICLLFTYARGAWLAVVCVSVLMIILQRNRWMLGALALTLATALFFMPAPLKQRFASLTDMKNTTTSERRLLWAESLQMLERKPWLGHGVNTYSKVEPNFKSKEIYSDNQYAHNGYLQIAAETGILGLGAFLLVLGTFFWRSLTSVPKHGDAFLRAAAFSATLGVLSLLLQSLTDTALQSLRLVSLLWLSMGFVLAAANLMTKRSS